MRLKIDIRTILWQFLKQPIDFSLQGLHVSDIAQVERWLQ